MLEKSETVKHFELCTLEPVTAGSDDAASSTIVACDQDDDDEDHAHIANFQTTSFYLDASGRSKMSLPLKFTFSSLAALDHFLAHDSIQPLPENIAEDEDSHRRRYEALQSTKFKTSLGFEVTTARDAEGGTLDPHASTRSLHSVESSRRLSYTFVQPRETVIVEGITVTSCKIDGTALYFNTEVIVRASQPSSQKLTTKLHVLAVLSEQRREQEPEYDYGAASSAQKSKPIVSYDQFPDFNLESTLSTSRVRQTRCTPFTLNVALTDALAIDVTSVNGPTTGRTIVSLTMRHPNTHKEPVTITNIAMHPGHSRLELPSPPSQMHEAQSHASQHHHHQHHHPTHTVADMSKCVQWGYAPQTQPILPFTLYPHGAFATVLTIDAMEHMRSRTFKSPISVTAVVGSKEDRNHHSTTPTISSADAQWTTGRLAQEPSDAFRIDMQLQNKEFYVGEPFTIFLRVKNMSSEARDMMLLVAKDSDKSSSNTTASSAAGGGMNKSMTTSNRYRSDQSQRASAANTAVVSEVNGYTFGVWGLVADVGDPIFRLDRDQDLLAIDAALLLGEVKGHHSVEAQLRFNPLREGTLDVPNMQLFDKRNRKWYYCTHKLNIVAKKRDDMAGAVGSSKPATTIITKREKIPKDKDRPKKRPSKRTSVTSTSEKTKLDKPKTEKTKTPRPSVLLKEETDIVVGAS